MADLYFDDLKVDISIVSCYFLLSIPLSVYSSLCNRTTQHTGGEGAV